MELEKDENELNRGPYFIDTHNGGVILRGGLGSPLLKRFMVDIFSHVKLLIPSSCLSITPADVKDNVGKVMNSPN